MYLLVIRLTKNERMMHHSFSTPENVRGPTRDIEAGMFSVRRLYEN